MDSRLLDLIVAMADDDDHAWTHWKDINNALEHFSSIELDDEAKRYAQDLLDEAQAMARNDKSRFEIDGAIVGAAEKACQED